MPSKVFRTIADAEPHSTWFALRAFAAENISPRNEIPALHAAGIDPKWRSEPTTSRLLSSPVLSFAACELAIWPLAKRFGVAMTMRSRRTFEAIARVLSDAESSEHDRHGTSACEPGIAQGPRRTVEPLSPPHAP